jgi:isocitrate dehydrogenase
MVSVVATLNLNGDYLSDALAAQVGGTRHCAGANINRDTDMLRSVTTVPPQYADLDQVNRARR